MRQYSLILFCSIILLYSCNPKDAALDISSYRLDTLSDATPAMLKILTECRDKNIQKLILPKATYHFYDTEALDIYMAVSNNTNSLKRVAFPLLGFHNFEIDASGSEFMFHGMIVPFAIEQSSHITLKNFSIDFEKPFYGQALVIAVNKTNNTFDIRIDGEWSYEIHDKNLCVTTNKELVNPGKNLWFDPETKATVYNVNNYKIDPWNKWINDSYEAMEVEPGIVRIKNEVSKLPEMGWIWVFKGTGNSRYIPGIRIFESKDISLSNVTMYHTGAMGLIAERSENITMNNLKAILKEGSNRIVSTTADATHFVNCKGLVKFDNCTFENMLDDATNVHGIYTKLTTIKDPKTIGVNLVHHEQWGFRFAAAGDSLLISNNNTFEPVQAVMVEKVRYLNEEYIEIELTESISNLVKTGMGVENISWQASMEMKNCVVQKNRARSILISTRGDVRVENNYFSSMMGAISIAGDMNFWYESGPVENVVIRKNTFVNHCTGGKGNTVIMINPNIRDKTVTGNYFHQNITIDSNVIKTFDRGILYAEFVENLKFTNNQIIQTTDFKPIFPDNPTIRLERCNKTLISGNSYEWDTDAELMADSVSYSTLNISDNNWNAQIQIIGEGSNYEVQ